VRDTVRETHLMIVELLDLMRHGWFEPGGRPWAEGVGLVHTARRCPVCSSGHRRLRARRLFGQVGGGGGATAGVALLLTKTLSLSEAQDARTGGRRRRVGAHVCVHGLGGHEARAASEEKQQP
jgi:hypothetical protein